jgi:hypothetical protein
MTNERRTDEHDDDPQGMRGQLDDSMDGLEAGDDAGEAARGIPQNADTTTDGDAAPDADGESGADAEPDADGETDAAGTS